jgi:hypothetical protein
MHGLAGDQPVHVAQGDFAQEFLAVVLRVAMQDEEAFAGELDASIGLQDGGGGHGGNQGWWMAGG